MEIKKLSILDYFKFKSQLNINFFDKTWENIFKFYKTPNLIKVRENNNTVMIWYLDIISKEISYINKVIRIKEPNEKYNFIKKSVIQTLKYSYETCKEEMDMDKYGFEKENSNITMKAYVTDLKINNAVNKKKFVIFQKGVHDKLRCDIQNSVFYRKNRIPVTIKDIVYEYKHNYFIDNLAAFVKKDDNIIGYGQIMLLDGQYTVANFCIMKPYQNQGFGNELLNYLLNGAKERGLNEIYIKVKSNNNSALHLYKKFGFKEFLENEVYEIRQISDR